MPPRGGPCAERRPSVPEGLLFREDWRRPLCREEAPVPLRGSPCAAERRPLCGREEAPVPRGGLLCRKVFCAERIGGGPVSGGDPCAERRPLVPLRGSPCAAERRPLCRQEEAPVPRGGLLCRKVFCAERIGGDPVSGGGPCAAERRPRTAERRPLCR